VVLLQCVTWSFHTEDPADGRLHHAASPINLKPHHHRGRSLDPRNLTRVLDELIVAADVRRIRFHDLRHTCASLLLAQGVPARVVMDVLGHSQFSITMDLYSHVMPSALREAADAIDRALG